MAQLSTLRSYTPTMADMTVYGAPEQPPMPVAQDSMLTKSLRRGWAGMQSNLQNVLARGQESFGFYDAAKENYAGAQQRMQDVTAANPYDTMTADGSRRMHFTEALDQGRGMEWLAESGAEGLPQLGVAIGIGAATRLGATKFLGPVASNRIIGKLTTERALAGGAMFAHGATQNAGEFIGEQDNSQLGQNLLERNLYAGGVGAAAGAVDTLVPGGMVGKFGLRTAGGEIAEQAAKRGLFGTVANAAATPFKTPLKEMGQEGLTEAVQLGISDAGHYAETDGQRSFSSLDDYIDNAAAGAASAGAPSVGTSVAAGTVNGFRRAGQLAVDAGNATLDTATGLADATKAGYDGRTLDGDANVAQRGAGALGTAAAGVRNAATAVWRGGKQGVQDTDWGQRMTALVEALPQGDTQALEQAVRKGTATFMNAGGSLADHIIGAVKGAYGGAVDNAVADRIRAVYGDLGSGEGFDPARTQQFVKDAVQAAANYTDAGVSGLAQGAAEGRAGEIVGDAARRTGDWIKDASVSPEQFGEAARTAGRTVSDAAGAGMDAAGAVVNTGVGAAEGLWQSKPVKDLRARVRNQTVEFKTDPERARRAARVIVRKNANKLYGMLGDAYDWAFEVASADTSKASPEVKDQADAVRDVFADFFGDEAETLTPEMESRAKARLDEIMPDVEAFFGGQFDFANPPGAAASRARRPGSAEQPVQDVAFEDIPRPTRSATDMVPTQAAQRQPEQDAQPTGRVFDDAGNEVTDAADDMNFSRRLQLNRVEKQRNRELSQLLGTDPNGQPSKEEMRALARNLNRNTAGAAAFRERLAAIDAKYGAERERVNSLYDGFDAAKQANTQQDMGDNGYQGGRDGEFDEDGSGISAEMEDAAGDWGSGISEYNSNVQYAHGSRGPMHPVRKGSTGSRTNEYMSAAAMQDRMAVERNNTGGAGLNASMARGFDAQLGWTSAHDRLQNMTAQERSRARAQMLDAVDKDYMRNRMFAWLQQKFGEDAGTREQFDRMESRDILEALSPEERVEAKRYLSNSLEKHRHAAFIQSFVDDDSLPERLRDELTMPSEQFKAKYGAQLKQRSWRQVIAEHFGTDGVSNEAFAEFFGPRYADAVRAQEDKDLKSAGFPTIRDRDDTGNLISQEWWNKLRPNRGGDGRAKKDKQFGNLTLTLVNKAASDELGGTMNEGQYKLIINPAQLSNLGKDRINETSEYERNDAATRMRFFAEGLSTLMADPRVSGVSDASGNPIRFDRNYTGEQGPLPLSEGVIADLSIDGDSLIAGFTPDGKPQTFSQLLEEATGRQAGTAKGKRIKELLPQYEALKEKTGQNAKVVKAEDREALSDIQDELYDLGHKFSKSDVTRSGVAYEMSQSDTIGELEAFNELFTAGLRLRRAMDGVKLKATQIPTLLKKPTREQYASEANFKRVQQEYEKSVERVAAWKAMTELLNDPQHAQLFKDFDPSGKLTQSPKNWLGRGDSLEARAADIDERLNELAGMTLGAKESISDALAQQGHTRYNRELVSDTAGGGVADTLELNDNSRNPDVDGRVRQDDKPFNLHNPKADPRTPITRDYEHDTGVSLRNGSGRAPAMQPPTQQDLPLPKRPALTNAREKLRAAYEKVAAKEAKLPEGQFLSAADFAEYDAAKEKFVSELQKARSAGVGGVNVDTLLEQYASEDDTDATSYQRAIDDATAVKSRAAEKAAAGRLAPDGAYDSSATKQQPALEPVRRSTAPKADDPGLAQRARDTASKLSAQEARKLVDEKKRLIAKKHRTPAENSRLRKVEELLGKL